MDRRVFFEPHEAGVSSLPNGTEWAEKHNWLEENTPVFFSHRQASSKLLEIISTQGDKRSLGIGGKEFEEEAKEIAPDGLPVEGNPWDFNRAEVKITITGALKKVFYEWPEDIQKVRRTPRPDNRPQGDKQRGTHATCSRTSPHL